MGSQLWHQAGQRSKVEGRTQRCTSGMYRLSNPSGAPIVQSHSQHTTRHTTTQALSTSLPMMTSQPRHDDAHRDSTNEFVCAMKIMS